MHYYDFNIADYRADTGHLKPLEHYIYRTLMDTYYLDERPIPKETQSVLRRLGLGSQDEATALQNVLNDFFELQDDGYHHGRIDAELVSYKDRAAKNRENGKNGGRPKANNGAGENPVGYGSVSENNPVATDSKGNQEPRTNNQEPVTNKKHSAYAPPIPPELLADWKKNRGKHAITETVFKGFQREADKAGITVEDAIRISIERGWRGFNAEWVSHIGKNSVGEKFDPTRYVNDKDYAAEWDAQKGGGKNGRVINHE